MTPLEQLQQEVAALKLQIDAFAKSDRYLLTRALQLPFNGSLIKGVYFGTSANPPPGWTVTLGGGGSAGQDTIAHNLGTTNYAVFIQVIGTTNETFTAGVANITANSFNVYTAAAGTLVAKAIHFLVIRY